MGNQVSVIGSVNISTSDVFWTSFRTDVNRNKTDLGFYNNNSSVVQLDGGGEGHQELSICGFCVVRNNRYDNAYKSLSE